VYERYELVCDLAVADPPTLRRVRDFLRELEMLGALTIEAQNRGPRGGQFLEADIGHAIDAMITALDGTIDAMVTALDGTIDAMVTALDGTIDELGAHNSIVEHLPD
jgi:Zn-dependent oligopeptidase